MKKTFSLNDKSKPVERVVDSIKHEVKKYIARERRKDLPELADFWDFDCKIGVSETEAGPVHVASINEMISKMAADKNDSFYLEVLAKPARRMKK